MIYGDGARDVRVFGSYFAGCLVPVSYWYSWIRNLGLWVWVGLGGGGEARDLMGGYFDFSNLYFTFFLHHIAHQSANTVFFSASNVCKYCNQS